MALVQSSSIVTNGLVFYYDMNNTQKSWLGAPTTNLVSDGMSIYNNVPSDVSATLTATTEYYRGAQVYQLTLTPITATGVSYLTNANNPGIGVVSNGGGGLANRFTGHAIFYRSTVPLNPTPLFTNYSNIPGWGAGSLGSNRSVSMGDGWTRAEVIWYDTVTRSDGKYWAINPLNATLNVPITIFWAGPFKEDRNDSGHVAAYTPSSRTSTQSIIDLTRNNTFTPASLTYDSTGAFNFNGSSDYIDITNNLGTLSSYTISFWARRDAENRMPIGWRAGPTFYWYGDNSWFYTHGGVAGEYYYSKPTSIPLGTWGHYCVVYNGSNVSIYRQGVFQGSQATTGTADWTNGLRIGYWNGGPGYYWQGRIDSVSMYNRALTDLEVQQNFNALRGRYGL